MKKYIVKYEVTSIRKATSVEAASLGFKQNNIAGSPLLAAELEMMMNYDTPFPIEPRKHMTLFTMDQPKIGDKYEMTFDEISIRQNVEPK